MPKDGYADSGPTEAAALNIGYFEKQHGEQWIFTCDHATRAARLRGRARRAGQPAPDARVDGLILTPVGGLVLTLEVLYLWVDGVYVKAGLEKDKAASLVV
jgi:hypothetical protein